MKLGLIFPFDDEAIVSEKPIEYHFKNKTLHCETGPAMRFSDGFCLWILNGVRMKQEHVETPWDKLDVRCILTETNSEVRRELVNKIGIERIVKELGANIIDRTQPVINNGEKPIDTIYELLELDLGDGRRRPYLKMICPSTGLYHIEGVPPGTKTVREALEFRNGREELPLILT